MNRYFLTYESLLLSLFTIIYMKNCSTKIFDGYLKYLTGGNTSRDDLWFIAVKKILKIHCNYRYWCKKMSYFV